MQEPDSHRQSSYDPRRIIGSILMVIAILILLGTAAYSLHAGILRSAGNTAPKSASAGLTRPAQPPITCTTPQHSPGNINGSITSAGLKRTFLLHLAPSYGRQPQPLVINYHGYGITSGAMAQYTDMGAEADKAGFILVFPQGVDSPPSWNAGIGAFGPTGDANDIQFTRDLISYLEKNYCVDAHHIYVTGYSLGAGMAYRVACTLSNQIAALATVAGAFYHAPGGCNPSHPIPVLEIHGQEDMLAPYNGNPPREMAAVSVFLNVWFTHDQCDTNTSKVIFHQGDVTGTEWPDCADGTIVEHYRISVGGHVWPGAIPRPSLGFTTHVINANVVIWNFFSQFKS